MGEFREYHPIRTAVIGLGRAGWDIHARELRGRNDFEICAVFDPLAERRHEAEASGFRAYETLEEMLRNESPELTIVASPSHLHESHTLAALASGSHVACEKPLAGSVAAARRMVEAANRNDRLLIPIQPRRFTPTARALRETLSSGKLGRIFSLRFIDFSYVRRRDWQCSLKYGGGMLSNHGAHVLDLAFHLLHEFPEEFHCFLARCAAVGDAEDHVQFGARTSNGVFVEIVLSNAACCPPHSEWMLLGECGSCRISGGSVKLRWFDPEELPPLTQESGCAASGRFYGNPETIPWRNEEIPLTAFPVEHGFYDGVSAAIRRHEPAPVDCRETICLIALLEECRRFNPCFSVEEMKSALISVTFRQYSPEAVMMLAVRGGVEAIEWGGDIHLPPGSREQAGRIAGRMAEVGLTSCSYGSYYRLEEAGFGAVLATAVALQVPVIRIWGGNRPSSELSAADRRLLGERAKRAADRAAAFGIRVALEYHAGTITDTSESAERFFHEEAEHPNLFSYWQPKPDQTVRENVKSLRMLGAKVIALHVFSWRPTANGNEKLPLAAGIAAWRSYLDALPAGGIAFAGLEFVRDDSPEQFLSDAATLRELLRGEANKSEPGTFTFPAGGGTQW